MRVKSSLINISVGLGNQVIITSLSFVSRTIFIKALGVEYLGINGLFTNILAMLSLAEAGIGSSIMYSLYKPVAENDQEKVNVLMNLYKKAYMVIALIVLLLGLALLPFLNFFVKNTHVENIHFIYFIFLLNTVAPYLYVHKSSFLNVCQKSYIVTGLYSISSIISVCLKIGILYFTKNYILYLAIDFTITIINSIILSIIANRKYNFLRNKISNTLDSETTKNVVKNIKAIILQNIGNYLVFGTDNIIISSFVSVIAVGLYSNYNMLIEICRTFINQIFNNIYHSVGNLIAKESNDKVFQIYKVYQFLNFWIYSFFTIFLLVIIQPFITMWLGPKFIMGKYVLLILIICFYERGMRNSITTVKTTSGIFHEDRYVPLFQAIINLFFSIFLVKYIGIAGVFLGTLISALAVPFWTTPYFVYRKVFHKPLISYFLNYTFYLLVGFCTYLVTDYLCLFFPSNDLVNLFAIVGVSIVVPNTVYMILFYKTDEFKYLISIINGVKKKVLERAFMNSKATSRM